MRFGEVNYLQRWACTYLWNYVKCEHNKTQMKKNMEIHSPAMTNKPSVGVKEKMWAHLPASN